MQYALLVYGQPETQDGGEPGPMDEAIAAILAQPCVTGWARLYSDESATTLRRGEGAMLLTDGPFIDSKEYLAGLILVEADDLDSALAVAQDLQDARRGDGAIEVRPIFAGAFRAA